MGWQNFFTLKPDDPILNLTRHPGFLWPLHPDYVILVSRGGDAEVTHRVGFPCGHHHLSGLPSLMRHGQYEVDKLAERADWVICSNCYTLFRDDRAFGQHVTTNT